MSQTSNRIRPYLDKSERIVIKVGSALLVDDASGRLHTNWLEGLVADIAELTSEGKQVVLVSSGSVALGRDKLGISPYQPLLLEEKQAAAACGQTDLIHAYQHAFTPYHINVAQILVTLEDSDDRRRYMNASATLETLLDAKVVPIINENDSITTHQIRFGDNDRLAARIGQMVEADLLLVLSDIDGLYTADPNKRKDAKFIPLVKEITPKIMAMGGDSASAVGSGGMATKIEAARIATESGAHMVLAHGHAIRPISKLKEGARFTLFEAAISPHSARKLWIAHRLRIHGSYTVDDGAYRALQNGRSLLPAGITAVEGAFNRGDAVEIRAQDGKVIAKGLSAFSHEDAKRIQGRHTDEVEDILQYTGRCEIIHRDNMVVYDQTE